MGSTGDNGQGTEIGQGTWIEINPVTYADTNGNVILRDRNHDNDWDEDGRR